MEKMQFSNIHIYDFFFAMKLDSLATIPFSQTESVFYHQDYFSTTSDFYSVIDPVSVLQCYNPIHKCDRSRL